MADDHNTDQPHTPTEAEAADLGRPLEAGESAVGFASTTGTATVMAATTFADRDSALDVAGAVMVSTLSGAPETELTAEQLAAQKARRERDDRKWHWFSEIENDKLDELHPNVIEALKRLKIAEAEWAKALQNIEGQYLKSLELSTVDHAAQADAVRECMDQRRY